jgi:hypothetical protein
MRIDVRSDSELRCQSLQSTDREMLDTSAVGNLTKEVTDGRTSKFVTKSGGTVSCASETTSDSPDILSFLNSWPYNPDDNVWVVRGMHGRDIMLVRRPMGLEVYEVEGRPDGQRPHGMESELDCQLGRLALAKGAHTEEIFRIDYDDCAKLFSEATIYYHRSTNFLRLKDWVRVEHDISRILRLCDFVERYAPSTVDRRCFEELRQSVTRMSAVAHEILFKESNGKGEAPKISRDSIAQREAVNGIFDFCRPADVALDSFQAFLSAQPGIVRKEALFIHQGDYWKISYQGSHAMLKATRGLRCLSCLLRHPGREFHVRELIAFLAETPFVSRLGETDAILDSKAKAEYKLRLDDLRSELQEAERFGDDYRAARARAEIDLLAQQLAAAIGLGGRDRRAPSDAERARSAVTKRIKEAVNRIGKVIPLLGRHLATQIKTGYYCSYSPDPDSIPAWTF